MALAGFHAWNYRHIFAVKLLLQLLTREKQVFHLSLAKASPRTIRTLFWKCLHVVDLLFVKRTCTSFRSERLFFLFLFYHHDILSLNEAMVQTHFWGYFWSDLNIKGTNLICTFCPFISNDLMYALHYTKKCF